MTLIKSSSMLFVVMMAANACSYGFHIVASRALGPADYGLFVSLMALAAVMVVPAQAIQITMARRVVIEETAGRQDRLRPLALHALWRVLALGLGLATLLWLTRAAWQRFLHMATGGPLLAVGFAVTASLVLPVGRGVLQGRQQFGFLGASVFSEAGLRLALGAWLLVAGGVAGGIWAGAAASVAALLLALYPLAGLPGKSGSPPAANFREMYKYGAPVLAIFGAFAVLTSLDMVLVKHFFEPVAAGYYAAAAVVGKAFLLLPVAMVQVLFPKASAGHVAEENTAALLNQSLGLTFLAVAAGAAAVWLLAGTVILSLFGAAFNHPETIQLVRWFGPAIAPLALVYVLLHYNLAVHRLRLAWFLIGDIAVLAAGLTLWHASLGQVLAVLGVNNGLLLAAIYRETMRELHVRPA